MNSSFSTVLPGLQLAWDSTSLSAFKECPRKYYYSIVLGYQPKQRSYHLDFGIYYHGALERYDHAKAQGKNHDEATIQAVLWAMKVTWHGDRPWFSGDSYKNRFTLIRTIVWYLEQFTDDIVQTVILANGKPAVELSFRYTFPHHFNTIDTDAIYCGHLDRLGKIDNQFWVLDRKTTQHAIDDRYFSQYSPDNQMSAYSLAGRIIYEIPVQGVIIDAAQILVNGSRFQRGFADRTEAQLEEWTMDTVDYLARAEEYAKKGYWPMNDKSCFNYGGCPFRPICARDPSVREEWLNDETKYVKRVWDPLQTRGDV